MHFGANSTFADVVPFRRDPMGYFFARFDPTIFHFLGSINTPLWAKTSRG